MPKTCSICSHPNLEKINKQLLTGMSYRDIAGRFGTSKSSLERHHKAGHIPDIMIKAEETKEIAIADSLLQQTQELRLKATSLLDQAESAGDLRAAGIFLRELRELVKLWAELEGRLATQPQINLLINPQWIELRTLIIKSLEPYPPARQAVIDALP